MGSRIAFLRLLFIIMCVFVEEGVGHSPSSYQRASPIDDHVLAMAIIMNRKLHSSGQYWFIFRTAAVS